MPDQGSKCEDVHVFEHLPKAPVPYSLDGAFRSVIKTKTYVTLRKRYRFPFNIIENLSQSDSIFQLLTMLTSTLKLIHTVIEDIHDTD